MSRILLLLLTTVIGGLSAVSATLAQSAEATSLLGAKLATPPLSAEARPRMEAQLATAVTAWENDRDDADAQIWVGRRTAYLGRFREAIGLFSDGIARHPNDARFYRHRGHRYLTIREIDLAIEDLRLTLARGDLLLDDLCGLPVLRLGSACPVASDRSHRVQASTASPTG